MGIIPIHEGLTGQVLPQMQETQSETIDGNWLGFDFQGVRFL
jgi:hypothetical protein